MRKLIAVAFLLCGGLVLISPKITDYLIFNHQFDVSFPSLSYETFEANNKISRTFRYDDLKDVHLLNTIQAFQSDLSKDTVGWLNIPSLSISLPIFKGMTHDQRLMGVCTMRDNQIIGQGNYPIAGNDMGNDSMLLGNLHNIQLEDVIKITDKKMVYEYKVNDITVVDENRIGIVEDPLDTGTDLAIVTLITANTTSANHTRFMVQGTLRNTYPFTERIQ